MKPVDQTLFGVGGNCMAAAIASVLELPLEKVPHFMLEHDTLEGAQGAAERWLRARGVLYMPMYFLNPEALQTTHFGFGGYHLLAGYSPRKNGRGDHLEHAVVAKLLPWGVELAHDPHPSRDGLLNWGHRWLELIVFPIGDERSHHARPRV